MNGKLFRSAQPSAKEIRMHKDRQAVTVTQQLYNLKSPNWSFRNFYKFNFSKQVLATSKAFD